MPNPVAAVDPLFHFEGVIEQIVVDNEYCIFQIKALSTVIRGDQDLAVLLELPDGRIICASVIDHGFIFLAQQSVQYLLGFHTLGENNGFLCCSCLFSSERSLHPAPSAIPLPWYPLEYFDRHLR